MHGFLATSGGIPPEIVSRGLSLLLIMMGMALVLVVSKTFIANAVRKAITRDNQGSKAAERKREETLTLILYKICQMAVWIIGIMLILSQVGINIGPLLAGASVAGVAIGFGAQAFIQDFISGLFIVVENRYRVGDRVTIAGYNGTVEVISIRHTVLRDRDGSKHFISNNQAVNVTNHTMDLAKTIVKVGVAYETDLEHVEKIVNQVGRALRRKKAFAKVITKTPYYVGVSEFGNDAVIIQVRCHTKPGKQWSVARALRKELKQAFDKNDIEIPYAQLVVRKHVSPDKK